ncbi:amidohydrolase family protein [Sphingomicrobium clamense]|uniref:Amidohydrolase family protein n=1 Tax=Sphingomicrobium clamense TaxID=2851013 RepID=A0ABS6V5F9_9SPHN|nr:amidohydrolase family protein [Sphingomicrobium sp. B8]MBW0144731.1 amidohydrolase family protein [Sphingomicrobium sp. B8]
MIGLVTLALAGTAPDLVIRNARIVDVDSGTHVMGHVAIDAGKIVSVGDTASDTDGETTIVEAGGRYLIPGLWDTHVHSVTNWSWHAPAFLAYGITSVRNLHTSEAEGYALIRDIKAQGERGEAPRIIANGFIVGGEESEWGGMIKVLDAEDARAAVDAHIENGMDLIKVYHSMRAEQYRALIAYADERGLPVDGHLPGDIKTQEAVKLGQRTIEHGIEMSHGCSDWDKADALVAAAERPEVDGPSGPIEFAIMSRADNASRNEERCAAVAELMAEHGTVSVPTIVNTASRMALTAMATQGQENSLPRPLYERWMEMAASPLGRAVSELSASELQYYGRNIDYFRDAGVTVLAGTDVGNPFIAPGASLIRELEYLTEFGMTPREALASATTEPARVFEIEGLGCIAAGCIADLVLLDHDPLAEISNVRSIAGVVHSGTYKPKAELDAALAAALDKENSKGQ